jgi:hypothetical protein
MEACADAGKTPEARGAARERQQTDPNHMTDSPSEQLRCVICGRPINGDSHNAAPVIEGRCCDACNIAVVLPDRLRRSLESARSV